MSSVISSSRDSDVMESATAAGIHIPVVGGDDIDPSLVGGFRVIYDRETPFELRIQVSTASTQHYTFVRGLTCRRRTGCG
jgi:hypothetical protein